MEVEGVQRQGSEWGIREDVGERRWGNGRQVGMVGQR